ncbi:TPR-like protein [Pholiota conissans]|uniref:TPR-like protein n=1 Tax=Pholiota conissans TaxID=109636 RepID=A0A9P5YRN4_9AGAR|nr:TPR-like protein [Pholiota conissans]
MEDEKLSEMEMLLTATDLKEKGNAEFKEGDITRAQIFYSSSISTFPTPDAMNNLAACALRQNRFDVAESFATKALDIDLFNKPQSIAKAHYRRALARLHLAKFKEAHEDVVLAKQLNPSDASISELSERIESVSATVKSQDDIANFLKEQPQADVKMSFTEAFNKIEELDIAYIRIPEPALSSMKTLLPLYSY